MGVGSREFGGLSGPRTDQLDLDYEYGVLNVGNGVTDEKMNNGNVSKQTITVQPVGGTPGFVATQYYAYDSLNRLEIATENILPDGQSLELGWRQHFKFDRYGNRNFVTTGETATTTLGTCPTEICNPSISPNNNKLTSTGYAFDEAGNTTRDAQDRRFTYDAENKQTKVESLVAGTNTVNGTVGEYFYDAGGRRVKKRSYENGVLGEETIFVYDAASNLVAEYSNQIVYAQDFKVAYLTNDQLSSPRINTDINGNVTARHDYHPFGDEIATSQRTSSLGYTDDSVRKQFTGYERDGETTLDFAQARMFGYNLGRFTTPDPLLESADSVRPQSWNRYSYSFNNPLRFSDPTGMLAGDFYNLNGNKIGTDGNPDGKIHIVYDESDAKNIASTEGDYTGTVNGAITLPDASIVTAIGNAVDASNASTYDKSGLPALTRNERSKDGKTTTNETASGGFRETSVSWETKDGKTTITTGEGPYTRPQPGLEATVSTPSDADGQAHIHPSGMITKTVASGGSGIASTSTGPAMVTKTAFDQPPSQGDYQNATSGAKIVVAAGEKRVYIHNSSKILGTMKLENFLRMGRSR